MKPDDITSQEMSSKDRVDRKMMGEQVFPILSFPENWGIRMLPAFGGAAFRFEVIIDSHSFSVYYDIWDQLGSMYRPYFEVYPIDGDTFRCYKNEFHLLIDAVDNEVKRLDRKLDSSLDDFLIDNPEPNPQDVWDAGKNSI